MPKRYLQVPRIIWGAFLGATAMYLVILKSFPTPTNPPNPVLFPAFAAVALVLVVVSFVLPRQVQRQALRQAKLDIVSEPESAQFASFYRDAGSTQKVFADPMAAYGVAARCFQTGMILGVAMSEAIALLGFVLVLLGFPLNQWAPFYVVGFVLIGIRFPTEQQIIGPLQSTLGAQLPPPSDTQSSASG